MAYRSLFLMALLLALPDDGYSFSFQAHQTSRQQSTSLLAQRNDDIVTENKNLLSRRLLFQSVGAVSAAFLATTPNFAWAASGRGTLEENLYTILRVKEATQQETRLIKSGKFKDVQRANIKLAVKFMIENYNLIESNQVGKYQFDKVILCIVDCFEIN